MGDGEEGEGAFAVERVGDPLPMARKRKRTRKGARRLRTPHAPWTVRDLRRLMKFHPSVSNVLIAKRLKRTVSSVTGMACLLGLHKSPARLVRMGRENIALRWSRGARARAAAARPRKRTRRG